MVIEQGGTLPSNKMNECLSRLLLVLLRIGEIACTVPGLVLCFCVHRSYSIIYYTVVDMNLT